MILTHPARHIPVTNRPHLYSYTHLTIRTLSTRTTHNSSPALVLLSSALTPAATHTLEHNIPSNILLTFKNRNHTLLLPNSNLQFLQTPTETTSNYSVVYTPTHTHTQRYLYRSFNERNRGRDLRKEVMDIVLESKREVDNVQERLIHSRL